jgi:subtilase family serine protease
VATVQGIHARLAAGKSFIVVVAAILAALCALAGGRQRGVDAATALTAPSLRLCLERLHRVCLAPADVRAAYGVDVALRRGVTGKGCTIAIVVSFGSPTIQADLRAFDRAYGLPDPQLRILAPLGTRHPRNSGWIGETTLDVEWAHAIAPGARLVLLESPVDETEGAQGLPEFLALERYAVQRHLADVISQSWDATEDTLFDRAGRAIVAQFHAFYADAARRGVTVVAASGDEGTTGPDLSTSRLYPYPTVQYPASDPYVLGVGGTRLTVDRQGRIAGESAWAGSGGGLSRLFPEPAYQRGLPAATQRLLGGRRGVPDVSYNASNESPVLVYQGGKWGLAAGTSAAAPQWAGLIALADDAAGRDLGLVNEALYRLGASPRHGSALRDITSGRLKGPTGGHAGARPLSPSAAPGWDIATGLGAPRANGLIRALVAGSR